MIGLLQYLGNIIIPFLVLRYYLIFTFPFFEVRQDYLTFLPVL